MVQTFRQGFQRHLSRIKILLSLYLTVKDNARAGLWWLRVGLCYSRTRLPVAYRENWLVFLFQLGIRTMSLSIQYPHVQYNLYNIPCTISPWELNLHNIHHSVFPTPVNKFYKQYLFRKMNFWIIVNFELLFSIVFWGNCLGDIVRGYCQGYCPGDTVLEPVMAITIPRWKV